MNQYLFYILNVMLSLIIAINVLYTELLTYFILAIPYHNFPLHE